MKYFSFNVRDYFILDRVELNKDSSVLEIGVGLGGFANLAADRVKEFWGVDISRGTIDYLKSNFDNGKFYCLDILKNDSDLKKKFDVIVSADTLEHIEEPQKLFYFIKRHLSFGGRAFVTFPNESKEKHHGLTWFLSEKDILNLIEKSSLKVEDFYGVKETLWHKIIKALFWNLPKKLSGSSSFAPQVFDDTRAFKLINQPNRFKRDVLSFYSMQVTKMARLFPAYKRTGIDGNIKNKRLVIKLKNI